MHRVHDLVHHAEGPEHGRGRGRGRRRHHHAAAAEEGVVVMAAAAEEAGAAIAAAAAEGRGHDQDHLGGHDLGRLEEELGIR